MPDTNIAGGALSLGGSLLGSNKMSKSADKAAAAQTAMSERTRSDLLNYRTRGEAAGREIMRLLGMSVEPFVPRRSDYGNDVDTYNRAMFQYNYDKKQYEDAIKSEGYGSLMRDFTGEDLQNEPGYQFGMDQGMQALDRSAAARGNLLSGATLKAAQRYGQDYAGTKFNDAYQRDNNNKNRTFNWLMGLTTMGQNSTVQAATANQQTGNALGNLALQQGNAQAAGLMGAANAFQTYQNNQWQQNLLSSMNNNRIYQNAADTSYSGWDPRQLRAGTNSGWA